MAKYTFNERVPARGRPGRYHGGVLEQGLQIFGALLILAGFLLSQLRLLEPRSWSYLWLNFAGAALLAVLALRGGQWGFLLLEGAWALVALGGLLVRARQRLSSSPPSP